MLRSSLLLFVPAVLLAQGPSPHLSNDAPVAPAAILASAPFHGVWIDPDPARDGRLWCRGDRYKMSFGADGALYLPLFSSHAPRHFPLAFQLAGAVPVAPERVGDGFVFQRGAIEERWDLRPEGAEQSFVLYERPVGGALVIEVRTELPYGGSDPKGLHFVAEGWGEVVYGHAFAVGDAGQKTPLPTTFAGGAIRIELPADATYPLVVDPFVSTIGVASNEAFDNRNPDVAYQAASDRWCVAMEERVSLLDTDIKVRRFRGDGTLLDTDYFETSGAVADQPAVAAATGPSSGSFLVVWREASLDIKGRRVVASAATPLTTVTFFSGSLAFGSFGLRPDVAGSQVDEATFLVVYVTEATSLPPQVIAALLGAGGQVTVAITTGCVTPRVASTRRPNQDWAITWTRQASGCLGGDVHLAVLNRQLGFELQPIAVTTSVFDDDRNADVAWDGDQGLIVWDRDQGNHHDVFGRAFQRTAAGYALLGAERNLSAMEPGITLGADQRQPVIASDGTRFVVAYMEGSTPKPICATFAIDNGVLECHEGHVPIATANLDHDDLGIAAMGTTGGALTRYFVVTDERDGSNDYDVQGLFYDGRQTGAMFTTVATGCTPINAAEPLLAVSGTSDLGHTFQITMSGHRALPFVLAGIAANPTPLLCTVLINRQCRQGVQIPLLVSQFGSSLQVVVPPSVGLVGVTLAFQGADVLATGACGPNVFGAAFSVTDTIQATIR